MRHWTPEERLKQAELIKKWKPWKQSTGAKTPEGKASSSQNAYKHGMSRLIRELGKVLREQRDVLSKLDGCKRD